MVFWRRWIVGFDWVKSKRTTSDEFWVHVSQMCDRSRSQTQKEHWIWWGCGKNAIALWGLLLKDVCDDGSFLADLAFGDMMITIEDGDADVDGNNVALLNRYLVCLDFQGVQDRSDALPSWSSVRRRDVQQWSGPLSNHLLNSLHLIRRCFSLPKHFLLSALLHSTFRSM